MPFRVYNGKFLFKGDKFTVCDEACCKKIICPDGTLPTAFLISVAGAEEYDVGYCIDCNTWNDNFIVPPFAGAEYRDDYAEKGCYYRDEPDWITSHVSLRAIIECNSSSGTEETPHVVILFASETAGPTFYQSRSMAFIYLFADGDDLSDMLFDHFPSATSPTTRPHCFMSPASFPNPRPSLVITGAAIW